MSTQRKITLTQAEYDAFIEASALWETAVYEEHDLDDTLTPDIKATHRALSRISQKWAIARR